MSVEAHGKDKYINSECVSSSAGLDWPSLTAERWTHGEGRLHPLRPMTTEIAVQLSGNSRVRRRGDGQVQDNCSSAGTVWLCPAGIFERSVKIFAEIKDCLHIYVPHKQFSHTALEEFGVDPDKAEVRYEGGFHDPFIEQVALNVRDELESPSNLSGLMVETMRVALSAHLLKNYSNLSPARCDVSVQGGSIDPKRMQRVIEFINANLHRNITLSELAAEACYSPHHFARLFKESTGQSPGQFVKGRRIEMAKSLLAKRHLSLANIATRTGFSSQSHFSRSFSNVIGIAPGAYRASVL